MQKREKRKNYRINTNIDFQLRSPLLKAVLWIIIIVLLLTVAVYQFAIRMKKQKELPTETALISTVYKNVTAQAVILRSETILKQTKSGTVVPNVPNGSKVAINDTVAKVFSNSDDARNASDLAELQDDIDYYEGIADLSPDNLVAGIDLYNSNITKRLVEMSDCATANNLSEFSAAVKKFCEAVTKKQIAVGEKVDVSEKLQVLYDKLSKTNGSSGSYSTVTAPVAGYYVNFADGYEDVGDISSLSSLTSSDVDELLNLKPTELTGGVGKLITEFNWYLICSVDEAQADSLEVGDNIKIGISELNGEVVTMKLKFKNPGMDNRTVLVFSSNKMDAGIAALRFSQIKIHVDEYKGYQINKKALRTVDGEVGVYIQLGNLIKFRKTEIIYSDNSVIIAAEKAEDGYLKLYDEIIVEGIENVDGKIIV